MGDDLARLGAAYDFDTDAPSILLKSFDAAIKINGHSYHSVGEARLDLLPSAHVHLYGTFQNVPPFSVAQVFTTQDERFSFSMNGQEIKGGMSMQISALEPGNSKSNGTPEKGR